MPKRDITHINLIGNSGGNSKKSISKGRRKFGPGAVLSKKSDIIDGARQGRNRPRRGK